MELVKREILEITPLGADGKKTEGTPVVLYAKILPKRILDDQIIELLGNELGGKIDDAPTALAQRAIANSAKIILDFSDVEYLSSAALGKLIVLRRGLGEDLNSDKKLILCSIRPDIMSFFKIMGFDRLFNIADTQLEAEERMGLKAQQSSGTEGVPAELKAKSGYSRF